MIRLSTPARRSAAVASVVGALALAGCSGAADAEMAVGDGDDYADGTYTAEGTYQTPETIEQVSVTLTLADGVVTAVEVEGDPQAVQTKQYQAAFISGIEDEVVGVPIDSLDVQRVSGSSLTSGGFNDAVESIKEQAAF